MADRRAKLRVVTALVVVVASLIGCTQRTPMAAPTTPGKTDQVQIVPFDLYTHCGIKELAAYGRYFQHVGGSLDDGSGNPPKGWGNPYQRGTLTVSGDIAVFRDKVGHVETFKVGKRPAGFLNLGS